MWKAGSQQRRGRGFLGRKERCSTGAACSGQTAGKEAPSGLLAVLEQDKDQKGGSQDGHIGEERWRLSEPTERLEVSEQPETCS